MQVGQPSEDCENDHNGKSGSSKLAMGLKMAAAGAELAVAGAELVETLGQLMFVISYVCHNRASNIIVDTVQHKA